MNINNKKKVFFFKLVTNTSEKSMSSIKQTPDICSNSYATPVIQQLYNLTSTF